MRLRLWMIRFLLLSAMTLVLVEGIIIYNLASLNQSQSAKLKVSYREKTEQTSALEWEQLHRELMTRSALYHELIKSNMLVDGMVVARKQDGSPSSLCDSLLFSSLRFYSLSQLGFAKDAENAWNALLTSRVDHQWLRHPQCPHSLSRDMVMGLLTAFRANPPEGDQIYLDFLRDIDRNWGYVGDGPFYVSWLSPGVAGLLRMEAQRRNIPFSDWPWNLKNSFSSIEYDATFLQEGYISHLAALGLWLEIEASESVQNFNPRSFFGLLERVGFPNKRFDTRIDSQRRHWIGSRLRSIHPQNLFYEWLTYRAYGPLSQESKIYFAKKLLNLRQFPIDRLPMDCDRDADYLWQRRLGEFYARSPHCEETWNGVDLLWMTALIIKG